MLCEDVGPINAEPDIPMPDVAGLSVDEQWKRYRSLRRKFCEQLALNSDWRGVRAEVDRQGAQVFAVSGDEELMHLKVYAYSGPWHEVGFGMQPPLVIRIAVCPTFAPGVTKATARRLGLHFFSDKYRSPEVRHSDLNFEVSLLPGQLFDFTEFTCALLSMPRAQRLELRTGEMPECFPRPPHGVRPYGIQSNYEWTKDAGNLYDAYAKELDDRRQAWHKAREARR